jgi:hypothetical protein
MAGDLAGVIGDGEPVEALRHIAVKLVESLGCIANLEDSGDFERLAVVAGALLLPKLPHIGGFDYEDGVDECRQHPEP